MIRLLRSYLFWTYPRGSFHYDVMVTAILLFVFVSPHLVDFRDRPIPEVPQRASEVLVRDAGPTGAGRRLVYEIRADDLHGARDPAEVQKRVAQILQNLSAGGSLETVKPITDPHGRVGAYDAIVGR